MHAVMNLSGISLSGVSQRHDLQTAGRRLERAVLNGAGIGDHVAVGRAVVVEDFLDALARTEPGDILVTRLTNPAFNPAIRFAGGLVTETGGALSHTGVAAREYGIPAVVGADHACSRITDGDQIEVDPIAGTVTILQPATA